MTSCVTGSGSKCIVSPVLCYSLCLLQLLLSAEGLCGCRRQGIQVSESWFPGGRLLLPGPSGVFLRLRADPRSSARHSGVVDRSRHGGPTLCAAPVCLRHPTPGLRDLSPGLRPRSRRSETDACQICHHRDSAVQQRFMMFMIYSV